MDQCAQKEFCRADIVRDVRLRRLPGLAGPLLLRLSSWYIQFFMKRLLPFLLVLVVPLVSQAQDDTSEFRALVEKSVASSSLIAPGSQPFHLKLEAADSTKVSPEY